MDDLKPWLGLCRVPGLPRPVLNGLLERFGGPAEVFAEVTRGRAPEGLSAAALAYLRAPDWDRVAADLDWLRAAPGRHVLTQEDPRFPPLLAGIPDPPLILFVQGDPEVLSQPQLALVGSRHPTPGGIDTALSFARELAGRGLVITSGLALGIDGAGHRGALEGGGLTVAVMGTGPDRLYPAQHRELARQIVAEGAVVSEFPPGTPPRPDHFPRRNRLISGLSLGTLVVEAAVGSGSLITARLAVEQGREVFAIPGSIHNPLARGCHALIRQGAKLVETVDHVLEELGPLLRSELRPAPLRFPSPQAAKEAGTSVLAPEYQALLDAMGYDPVGVDTLVERGGLTPGEVSSMLLLLELRGHVAPVGSGRYARVRKGS